MGPKTTHMRGHFSWLRDSRVRIFKNNPWGAVVLRTPCVRAKLGMRRRKRRCQRTPRGGAWFSVRRNVGQEPGIQKFVQLVTRARQRRCRRTMRGNGRCWSRRQAGARRDTVQGPCIRFRLRSAQEMQRKSVDRAASNNELRMRRGDLRCIEHIGTIVGRCGRRRRQVGAYVGIRRTSVRRRRRCGWGGQWGRRRHRRRSSARFLRGPNARR